MSQRPREIDAGFAEFARLDSQGRYVEAIPVAERLYELTKRHLGASHYDTAAAMNDLGELYRLTSDYDRARPLLEGALEIWEQNKSQLQDQSTSVSSLLDFVLNKKRRKIAIIDQNIAAALDNLGGLYRQTGDYQKAESRYLRALEIRERVLGPSHTITARTLNNLAGLYHVAGSYEKSARLYERALAIRRRVLGEKHPDTATIMDNLGVLYHQLGRVFRARSLFEKALAIRDQALPDSHPAIVNSLNNIGASYLDTGQIDRAEPLFERALAIREKTLKPGQVDIAESLGNLAQVYTQKRDYEKARSLWQRSLAIQEAVGPVPNTAVCLQGLGQLAALSRDFNGAEPLLQRALEILKTTLDPQHPAVGTCIAQLAMNYAAQSQWDKAFAGLVEAAAVEDRTLSEVLSLLPEIERARCAAQARVLVEATLSLVFTQFRDAPGAVSQALDILLRRKTLAAEVAAVQHQASLSDRYPHLKDRFERLALLRGQIARKVLSGPDPKEREKGHRATLDQWRDQCETLEAELAREIPELRLERELAEADSRTVASRLPDGGALIEFAKFHLLNFQAVPARGEEQQIGERYVAFLLASRAPEQVRLVDLGEAGLIDAEIQAFRARVTGTEDRGMVGPDEENPGSPAPTETETDRLRALVFDPLAQSLGSCRRLMIAPDGELTRLPFEALLGASGRPLLDDFEISYLASGRDLLRLGRAATGAISAGPPLVIADPAFDLEADAGVATADPHPGLISRIRDWLGRDFPEFEPPGGPRTDCGADETGDGAWWGRLSRDIRQGESPFTALGGSRVEGEGLASRLGGITLIGETALEGRVKRHRSPAILHLATHGFFLPNQPRTAPNLTIGPMDRLALEESPMLRSGLALAGANTFMRERRTVTDDMEDGLLLAEDAARLDLLDTDLVFLSACETGLGVVQMGEGVLGLRSAFTQAGARTLIMTLWKISDLATAILVDRFYERLLAGAAKGEALREAQRYLRTATLSALRDRWLSAEMQERLAAGDPQRRHRLAALAAMSDDAQPFAHPYYWAGFILQGDTGPLGWHPDAAYVRAV